MKRLFILISFILISCLSELPTVSEFNDDPESHNLIYTHLEDSVKIRMNGVYKVHQGKDLLGEEIVGRWVDKRWCLYSKHDVVYSENVGGLTEDSTIRFKGYIRVVRSGSGTELDLEIPLSEGGSELLSGIIPTSLIIRGNTTEGSQIELKRIRELYKSNDSTKTFHIIAHRGGGRNAERLGISENSIEMIRHAEVLGATGVEIDVKRTRDGVLILFHDATFSPRTVSGTYLLGKVENFDLAQIQTFGRLYYGEAIPTLKAALEEIIYFTSLSLVWIDVKDPDIVNDVILKQLEAIEGMGNRDLLILLGIPEEEVLNSYRASSLKDQTPILIELDAQDALDSPTCKVWAPRWTNSIPLGKIQELHAANKFVFTWTLDVKEYIEDFIYDSEIDGILSNYPSQVAGMYLSQP
jgi:glycerophosphoryl diester phosphodiesterase